MALFNFHDLKQRAYRSISYKKAASEILVQDNLSYSSTKKYDIFLSHSFLDADIILGVKLSLEDLGYSIYVDWTEDPQLDRKTITKATAALLRERMNSSKCLFFATSKNSMSSKWMPWELGYKDGQNEKAAILPVSESRYENEYKGQEYLAIYPYIQSDSDRQGKQLLWIHENSKIYIDFDAWLSGRKPYLRN